MDIIIFSLALLFWAAVAAFVADKLIPKALMSWLERKLKNHIERK